MDLVGLEAGEEAGPRPILVLRVSLCPPVESPGASPIGGDMQGPGSLDLAAALAICPFNILFFLSTSAAFTLSRSSHSSSDSATSAGSLRPPSLPKTAFQAILTPRSYHGSSPDPQIPQGFHEDSPLRDSANGAARPWRSLAVVTEALANSSYSSSITDHKDFSRFSDYVSGLMINKNEREFRGAKKRTCCRFKSSRQTDRQTDRQTHRYANGDKPACR